MREGAPSLFKQGPPPWARLLVFALLSVTLMVVDARWRVLDTGRQYLAVAVYPFQYVMRMPRDALRQVTGWMDTADRIRLEAEALRRQRIELAQLATNSAQLAEENSQLRRLLGASERSNDPAVLVELLYESREPFNQRLIIDRGQQAGLLAGMPLIDENGVVGQIVRSHAYSAEVALLTDRAIAIPVQNLRTGLRAIAFAGTVPGKLELRYLQADVDLEPDDVLVTSGLGGWFPAGLPVARVEQVTPDPTSGYARVICQPTAGLDRYRHFLVLRTGPAPGVGDEEETPETPSTAPSGGS